MGLLDFFRRKRPQLSGQQIRDELLKGPRPYHYSFAHVVLRSAAFERPIALMAILGSPEADRFLDHLMRSMREQSKDRLPEPDFSSRDITIHRMRVGRFPCAVVEMPAPKAATEAFFVAAVLLKDLEQPLPDEKDVALRYFTLEQGMTLGGPLRTVLCEWTTEGMHVNYGDGPTPRVHEFIRAVEKLLI